MTAGARRGEGHGAGRTDPALRAPVTAERLADLQAAAAHTAALDRVRRELARLGSDPRPAAAVPAAVSARVVAALRAAAPGTRRDTAGG